MNRLLIIILVLLSPFAYGQINMSDSTAQVVSYWNIGDKQSYSMSLQQIKLHGADTTENILMNYDVDITVIDSTDKSYTVEWLYKNYKTNSTNELIKKITAISEDVKVIIETDEYGVIKGVKNWKEVSEYMKKSIQPITAEFKNTPQVESLIKQMESMYTTKQGIESAAIQDAQQFHSFHGAKYLLGEVLEFPIQVPSILDQNNLLQSLMTVSLDEINPEDNDFVLRSIQEVDSDQLTNMTYNYLKSMARSMNTTEPKMEDMGQLTNLITTASRIHGSGWVIYSIQTKTVEAPGETTIEERIIELK